MTPPNSTSALDAAFRQWLEQLVKNPAADSEAFIASQPTNTQRKLRTMIEDHRAMCEVTVPGPIWVEENTVVGDFRLLKKLGKGGIGQVWQAEKISLKSQVALKILKPQFNFSALSLARFQREAEAGGRLNHDGIVKTFGVGESNGVHWIAQELVEQGRTLADLFAEARLQSELPVGWYRHTCELFAQIADAIHAAHQAGVIHRDVKPQNILLTGENKPKIADFGLAQIHDDLQLSRTGEFLGTPFYMSPEQAMSKRVELDHRTDIFSLGVTLYEALTLVRAFDGDTSQQVFQKILTEEPPAPQRLRSRVPTDLAVICGKCMEKGPERRYTTMAQVAEDLRRHLRHETIAAKPPTALAKAEKWCRRHPVVAVSSAISAVALISVSTLAFSLSKQKSVTLEAQWDAENQAKIATQKAHASEQAVEFVVRLFEQADPEIGEGYAVTPLDLLDNGAEWLSYNFGQEPELRARLLDVLAASYRNSGHPEQALALLNQSIELRQKIEELPAGSLLACENQLALTLIQLGDYAQAEALLNQVVVQSEEISGNQILTMNAWNNLGLARDGVGKSKLAEEAFLKSAAIGRNVLNASHPDRYLPINNLGFFYYHKEEYELAERYLKEAWQGSRVVNGESSPRTLASLNNYAMVLNGNGHYQEAKPLLEKVIEMSLQVNGPEHPNTLAYLNNVGMVAWNQNDLPQAKLVLGNALEVCRKVFTDDHPDLLVAISNLGMLLDEMGEHQSAGALLEEALEGSQRSFPAGHRDRLSSMSNYGLHLREVGEFNAAEKMMRDVLAQIEEQEEETVACTYQSNLGLILEDQGRLDDAEKWMRKALYGSRHLLGEADPKTLITLFNLSRILLALDRATDALPLATELVQATAPEDAALQERKDLLAAIVNRMDQSKE